VRAQVQSVSFFARANGLKDLAQVRFLKSERASGSGAERLTQWIATVQYVYGEPSSDPKRRLLNPLGFRIVESLGRAGSAHRLATSALEGAS
jgi:type IV secretory pathway component VirB8